MMVMCRLTSRPGSRLFELRTRPEAGEVLKLIFPNKKKRYSVDDEPLPAVYQSAEQCNQSANGMKYVSAAGAPEIEYSCSSSFSLPASAAGTPNAGTAVGTRRPLQMQHGHGMNSAGAAGIYIYVRKNLLLIIKRLF